MLWWLLAAAGVLVLIVCALLYNRLVRLRNRVDNAWSQVDVQLRRRYDLIPNLVSTLKAYAAHESEFLEGVLKARDSARSANTVEEQGRAESALTGAIADLQESPPGSLALWEQFLVYGIVLGVAEQVLAAARLHAPPEIAEGGSFYAPGYDGYVAGPTGFSFSDLENGFSSAFTPPSSSDSGGGGSFSGGGGGGGGGAW